jgi:hypothetical protein
MIADLRKYINNPSNAPFEKYVLGTKDITFAR